MGRQHDLNARKRKERERLHRRSREGNIRGDIREEFVERCLIYLKATGKIIDYLKTQKNSQLDRIGRDFIYWLSGKSFNDNRNRECHLDAKSSIWGLGKLDGRKDDFVLRFIPEVTRSVEEEARRLFSDSLEHVQKVQRIMEERNQKRA